MFRLQRRFEDPVFQFKETVGKIAYGVATLLRLAYSVGIFVTLILVADFVASTFFGVRLSWPGAVLDAIASSTWINVGLLVGLLIVIRQLLVRLSQPDTDSRT